MKLKCPACGFKFYGDEAIYVSTIAPDLGCPKCQSSIIHFDESKQARLGGQAINLADYSNPRHPNPWRGWNHWIEWRRKKKTFKVRAYRFLRRLGLG